MQLARRILAPIGALILIVVGAAGIALANDTLKEADAIPLLFIEGEGVPPRHGYVLRLPAPDLAVLDRPATAIADRDLDDRSAALLLAGLLVLPIAVVRSIRGGVLARAAAGDPPARTGVTTGPPEGLRAPETAGLLLEHDEDVLLIATLVDLDQRGALDVRWDDDAYRLQLHRQPAIEPTSATSDATTGATPDTATDAAADPAALGPDDAQIVHALVGNGPLTVTGHIDEDARWRVTDASGALVARSTGVFAEHGLLHDRLGWLASGWFRTLQGSVFGVYAVVVGWASAAGSPLTLEAVGAVIALVLAGAHLATLPWRHQQLPLSPAGRDAVAHATAFRDFVRTATPDELTAASDRPGTDHLPPAVSLLPYAIVFGEARTWLDRFGPRIADHVTSTTDGASGVWWTDHDRFLRAWTALSHAAAEEPVRIRVGS